MENKSTNAETGTTAQTDANTVLVAVEMKYAVWKDETYGYAYGTIEQSKEKEIVEYCKDYDEARITWKWYYYKP